MKNENIVMKLTEEGLIKMWQSMNENQAIEQLKYLLKETKQQERKEFIEWLDRVNFMSIKNYDGSYTGDINRLIENKIKELKEKEK